MNVKIKSAEFRALREKVGMSQARIAMRVGVSKQSIYYFEKTPKAQPEWPVEEAASWMLEIAERRGLA
jgi:DNA-binding XRE family transcriptional regulator